MIKSFFISSSSVKVLSVYFSTILSFHLLSFYLVVKKTKKMPNRQLHIYYIKYILLSRKINNKNISTLLFAHY